MKWAGLVTWIGEKRSAYGVLWGKLEERGHWEVLFAGGMMLKWILEK
jgi:hypothetical protein